MCVFELSFNSKKYSKPQTQCHVDLQHREGLQESVHVVNMDVKDNHREAAMAADCCVSFCELVESRSSTNCFSISLSHTQTYTFQSQLRGCDDLDSAIEDAITTFERTHKVHLLHTVVYQ